jgi:hypothetical protein
MAPLIVRFAGPAALHYPGLFAALPAVYARADVVLEVLVGPLSMGAAIVLFADRFRGRVWVPGAVLGEALRRYPTLLLAQLPLHAAIAGLTNGFGPWLVAHKHGLLIRIPGRLAVIGGAALAETLLVFVAALVMLERKSLFGALAALPGAVFRAAWAVLLISIVPLVARLVMQALAGRAVMVTTRGVPELVGALTLADATLSTLGWVVLAGSATMIYLGAMARDGRE